MVSDSGVESDATLGLWDAAMADAAAPDAGSACTAERVESQVLATSCALAGCHRADAAVAGLDLSTPGWAARLIDQPSTCGAMPLVTPGDPAASFLYQKLTREDVTCGAQMPLSGALDPAQLECVRTWIESL